MGFGRSNNSKNSRQKTPIFGFFALIAILGGAIATWFIVSQSETYPKTGEMLGALIETPTFIQVSRPSTPEYGIAAGGGLVFLRQDELEQYFLTLQSLGVQWIRWDIDWSVVQPKNSKDYEWGAADRVAFTAKRYGINSLGIITYSPKWAISPTCSAKSHCEPANPKEFGYFAGEVALRYKNTITHWEIWNEPNYAFFWGPKPNVEKYAEVLKESYLAIKKANSSAVVLSGGLASAGDKGDGSIPPLTFTRGLYELGANEYFDVVNIHPYTYPASPHHNVWWNRWQEILPMRKLMVDNGDSIKKIWITEFGTPTGGPGRAYAVNQVNNFKYGDDFMYEGAQVSIMKEAVNFYQQNLDWMGPFFWYSLKDASNKRDDAENFFGLLRYDGSKKPAYEVFKKIIASSTQNVVK